MANKFKIEEYWQRFTLIRAETEKICQPLLPEDTVVQPIVDVSPPKWHLAHTSWFFEVFILEKYLPAYQVFNPLYSYLFNSYYNAVGSRVMRDQRGTLSRPPLAEIYQYRNYINQQMQILLHEQAKSLPEEIWPVLEIGLQHEQQHQELLITDIKYILSTNPLLPVYTPAPPQAAITQIPEPAFLPVPAGFYTIGYTAAGFSFDNEHHAHQVWLPEFRVQNRPVTNQEYLAFMEAGGYQDFKYWLGEGFDLVRQKNWEAPLYWVKQQNEWFRFTLNGLQPINWDAPVVHVSFYEAAAYANWAGHRLLTEFEWEAASQVYQPEPLAESFLEAGFYDPQPAISQSENKLYQYLGEVWEWTNSAYLPYPGFETAPGALGEYNGKFMINQMVLRGGSCATPISHIRATYRNFFPADKRWQFSGIRLGTK
ncbi:MAG: ergothioneine biosynthesis protein EgtB [Adhaeribacter sp.]